MPATKQLLTETIPPDPKTCTILATNTIHWIRDTYTLFFPTVDRLVDLLLPTTTMMPTTENMTRCTPDQSNETASNLSNQTLPTQSTTKFDYAADNNFAMTIPMAPPETKTLLTPLPDSHFSDPDTTNQIPRHSENTAHQMGNPFAPVFKLLNCLATNIVNLSDSILAATSKSIVDPLPPTSNTPQHHPQSQPLNPRSYQLLHMVTHSCHAQQPITKRRPHTHQQNPYPKQTHQCHRNHTKHRDFVCPPIPILHCHSSNCLPPPVSISLPSYHRYLAHNFQPP